MNARQTKILLVLIIIISVLTSLFLLKIKCDDDAKRFYKQGNEFLLKNDYQNAYYNFNQINRFSNLYRISLLKQYKCALNLEDKKTAQKILLSLIKEIKTEEIRPYFLYNEAILSQSLGSDSEKNQLKKFKYIYDNYPNSDFKFASAFKIAKLIQSKEKIPAKEKYIEYLDFAPAGKFSIEALTELDNLKVHLSKNDYEVIAIAYLQNENYKKALENFQKTSFSNNWHKIADCYKGLNNKTLEKETILKGFSLTKSSVNEKEISSKIDRLAILLSTSKSNLLESLYMNYEKSYIFPTVVFKLAQLSTSIRSYKLYELVANNYKDSIWASNALWEVFWYNYKLSRYKTCIDIAKSYLDEYNNVTDTPRVHYWYAMALLKEKKTQLAKEAFYDVIEKYPLSYYAFLSVRRLKSSKAKRMILKKPIVAYNIDSINKFLFKDKLLLELANNNDFDLIDEFKINDEFVKSWSANKKEQYPLSINLAKNEYYKDIKDSEPKNQAKVNIRSDYRLKLMYPVRYARIINENAHELKQSPYLFLSLVREESHFNKNAKSSVGALGLAQIMPQTAKFIEKKEVKNETLYDEEENIRLGLKYFDYLVQYFKGDELLAILAYNAGPGNVSKWLKDSNISSEDIDDFTEDIPYLETKNYIKKILSSYFAYLNIYR